MTSKIRYMGYYDGVIVCPYCGHENKGGLFEYDFDTDYEKECLECEKIFLVGFTNDIKYSVCKMEQQHA